MFTMEGILHYMYVVAIKDTRAWPGDTPAEIAMIGFWNLTIVWLKVRSTVIVSLLRSQVCVVAPTMAVLPTVGTRGRHRPAGKHGAVHGEQLLDLRVLAQLAPKL